MTVDIAAGGDFIASYTTVTRQITHSAADGSYAFTWGRQDPPHRGGRTEGPRVR